MHIIPIFLKFSEIFSLFDNFDLIFAPSLFFSNFFSTDNNLSCLFYSRLPSFYNFVCIFYQIFSNFLIFWQLWPNFWASHTFFSNFFSTHNNLSCLFYSRLPSFYNFLCIFLGQNVYNTNFLSNFLIFRQLWPKFWASPTNFVRIPYISVISTLKSI